MKRIAISLIAALSLSGAALAQGLPTVSGTVEKVDTAQGKITIDHGPIKNLDMEAMTMVFRAQDPALLKGVKAGDKVQFTADRVNGQITVTSIKKAHVRPTPSRGSEPAWAAASILSGKTNMKRLIRHPRRPRVPSATASVIVDSEPSRARRSPPRGRRLPSSACARS